MVKFQEKMVTGKIAFEGEAWRSEWMDDVLCKGQAFQAERRQVLRMGRGRQPGRGLAGLELNQRLYGKEGWNETESWVATGVWDQVLQDRVRTSAFSARKSLAALSQEPWSQAAFIEDAGVGRPGRESVQ